MSVLAHRQSSQARGWWGMALLVATELTLLAVIVGSYFYLRFKAHEWPPPGEPKPSVTAPLVLAAILLASSVPVQLAYFAGRAGRARAAQLMLVAGLVLQVGFLVDQLLRFADELTTHPPQSDAYASIRAVLLGADHFHVAIGVFFSLFLLAKLVDGRITGYRLVGLQTAAFYWHFVNLLTVGLTLVAVSPSL